MPLEIKDNIFLNITSILGANIDVIQFYIHTNTTTPQTINCSHYTSQQIQSPQVNMVNFTFRVNFSQCN